MKLMGMGAEEWMIIPESQAKARPATKDVVKLIKCGNLGTGEKI